MSLVINYRLANSSDCTLHCKVGPRARSAEVRTWAWAKGRAKNWKTGGRGG